MLYFTYIHFIKNIVVYLEGEVKGDVKGRGIPNKQNEDRGGGVERERGREIGKIERERG